MSQASEHDEGLCTAIHDGPIAAERWAPAALRRDHGAVASFLGVVRDHHGGRAVEHLVYDCHRPMAETVLRDLAAEARARFDPDASVTAIHGVGRMEPGEVSLVLHVSSAHRPAAFDACRQLLERIKEDLPVWKQEHYGDGQVLWLPQTEDGHAR